MKATIDIIHTYNHCCSCKLNHSNYNIIKICSVLSEVLAEHIHNHPTPSVEDHVLVVRRSTSVSTITVSTLYVTHKTFSSCSWPRSRNVTMSLNIATSIVSRSDFITIIRGDRTEKRLFVNNRLQGKVKVEIGA